MEKQNVKVLSTHDFLKLLPEKFIQLSQKEQELSLAIYRELSKGIPVSLKQLVTATHQSIESIQESLGNWPGVYYKEDHIIGYWGLTISDMGHKILVDDQVLYGWCAWDTLFIPQLLRRPALIHSKDQTTNEEIMIELDRNGRLVKADDSIMVSLLIPKEEEITEDVLGSFCHFIYFFKNEENGQKWVREHPETFLISLKDAIELSIIKNAIQYKSEFN